MKKTAPWGGFVSLLKAVGPGYGILKKRDMGRHKGENRKHNCKKTNDDNS